MNKTILYCLLLHDNPRQTLRLLRAIYNRDDQFVLHVDRSAALDYVLLVTAISEAYPNITMLSNRVCSWGGFSLVEAEMDMLAAGLQSNRPWTHAAILSGTHLPAWPLNKFRDWLMKGSSCMSWYEFPHREVRPDHIWAGSVWDRFGWSYEEVPGIGMRRVASDMPPDFMYALGSQWVILARDHAAYALGSETAAIRDRLARTDIADSAFFQSILCNSPLRDRCDRKKNSTAVHWVEGEAHPRTFDLDEYAAFAKMSHSPFVRKIRENLGDETIVDETIQSLIGEVEEPHFREQVRSRLPKDDGVSGFIGDYY